MNNVLKAVLFAGGLLAYGTMAQAETLAEVHQKMETRFSAADANNDGKLTQKEAKNGGMWRLSMGFSRIDAQKRGYITLPQLKAIATRRHNK